MLVSYSCPNRALHLRNSAEGVERSPRAVVGVGEQVPVGRFDLSGTRAHEAGELKQWHLGGDRKAGERLPQGIRRPVLEALRDGLDHDLVVAAVKQSLAGGSESARVAAVKFLADLELYRKDEKDEPAHQAEIAAASRKLDALIERYVYDAVRESDAGVARDSEHHSPMTRLIAGAVARAREGQGAELDARIEKIFADVANGLQLVGDVSAERAERILGGLEEAGLLVRRQKVEEMAEEIARERLHALKTEHGLPI